MNITFITEVTVNFYQTIL